MKILIIDNYDSFTYNLFQYVAELTGIVPEVFYNDTISWEQFASLQPDAVIISPGPGNPTKQQDFGISKEIILRTTVPLLGVCLGHQGIAAAFGGKITHAPEVMHGRTSKIFHVGTELFTTLPQGFEAVRYHSLMVSEKDFPQSLVKTAWTNEGVIMGLKHVNRPLYGIQFHPESVGTVSGKKLLENFLDRV